MSWGEALASHSSSQFLWLTILCVLSLWLYHSLLSYDLHYVFLFSGFKLLGPGDGSVGEALATMCEDLSVDSQSPHEAGQWGANNPEVLQPCWERGESTGTKGLLTQRQPQKDRRKQSVRGKNMNLSLDLHMCTRSGTFPTLTHAGTHMPSYTHDLKTPSFFSYKVIGSGLVLSEYDLIWTCSLVQRTYFHIRSHL